jgi:hypothetical protein
MKHVTVRLAAAVCLVVLMGCSGGGNSVKGVIKLDGQPLANARVSFEPEKPEDKLGAAVVTTTSSGEFEIEPHPTSGETLMPGRYVVTVSRKVDKQGNAPLPQDMPQLEAAGLLSEGVPSKYSAPDRKSELRADIQPGKNELKFDLEGK